MTTDDDSLICPDHIQKLKHINIVTYKDSFVHDSHLCIVMSFCCGGDMQAQVNSEGAAVYASSKCFELTMSNSIAILLSCTFPIPLEKPPPPPPLLPPARPLHPIHLPPLAVFLSGRAAGRREGNPPVEQGRGVILARWRHAGTRTPSS